MNLLKRDIFKSREVKTIMLLLNEFYGINFNGLKQGEKAKILLDWEEYTDEISAVEFNQQTGELVFYLRHSNEEHIKQFDDTRTAAKIFIAITALKELYSRLERKRIKGYYS